MSIKDYKILLKTIINKLDNSNFNYENTIIIGDNSSGKSDILKSLVDMSLEKYYFIDVVNRTFDVSKVNNYNHKISKKYESISKYRIKENIFNLQDSFDVYGDGSGHIEFIFFEYFDEIKILFKKFLEVDLGIKNVQYGIFFSEEKLTINDEIEKLSNGYQALLRLFLEIIYIYKNKDENKITIVIDEIDEYLSSKNKLKIMPFLIKEFPEVKWIVTTHSADVICSVEDFNLIVLKENNYDCLDSNDFKTITDVQEIFRNLYNLKINYKERDINTTLRRLLSLKISEKWSEEEELELKQIEKEKLSNAQLLILHQIKNW